MTAWDSLLGMIYVPTFLKSTIGRVKLLISRVAYRSLNMERTPVRMKKLEAFLHESYGKQYHISFRKLM